ncbi:MAG: FtsX-like permease family protein [Pseudomonadota bacterium]
MGIYLTVALRNLRQARKRTALLGTALGLVTMLLVLLMSLSRGLSETMIHNATAVMSGHVNVAGFYKNKVTDAIPIVVGIDEIRKIAAENTPGLESLVDRGRGWVKVISEKSSLFVSPSGIDIEEEQRFRGVVRLAAEKEYKEGGRDIVVGNLDKLAEPHNALVFASQAKRLGIEVGDYLTLTAPTGSGRTNTIDVTVVAVAKDFGFMSNWNLFLPKQDIRELYQITDDTSSVVMLYLRDPSQAEAVMGHLRGVYESKGYRLMDHEPQPFFMKFDTVAGEDWTGQKLDLTVWSDEASFLLWVIRAIDGLSIILVSILLIIIGVGIMNSTWISVRDRTNEIGTVRAIGMTRSRVLLMFLTEALLLGLAGTSVGAVLGTILACSIDAAAIGVPYDAVQAILMSDVLHLSVAWQHVVGAVLGFTAVCGLSAMWPAIRASRLEPVTAIHRAG